MHISPTKTGAGTRTIPMLEEVRKAFLEMRKERIANGMCETMVDGYSDFVFTNSRNHVHKPNTINRVMDNIIKAYNKEEIANASPADFLNFFILFPTIFLEPPFQ